MLGQIEQSIEIYEQASSIAPDDDAIKKSMAIACKLMKKDGLVQSKRKN